MIHEMIHGVLNRGLGRRIEESISGTAGSKNRASWCGKILSKATPDKAEARTMVTCALRRTNRSGAAGPRS